MIITPEMIADAALARFTVEMEFLRGIPLPQWAEPQPDRRTRWQKFKSRVKDRVWALRHSLACRVTPYGFDDE
jgi:hypothetical protein